MIRFGNGIEETGEGGLVGEKRMEYFDYYTDGKLYYDNFLLGVRIEYVDPPEYSLIKKGITQRYLEYNDNGWKIRVGDSFSLFGRGLALNLFENRTLAFNTMLDGIKVNYSNDLFNVTTLYGKINYVDPQTVMEVNPYKENYTVGAGNLELVFLKGCTFGGSFTFSERTDTNSIPLFAKDTSQTQIWETYLKLHSSNFDLFVNYANKKSFRNSISSYRYGYALYSCASYEIDGLGVSLEYKDYRFDLVDPLQRLNTYRWSSALPFQNAPSCIKENSFTLLTRDSHVVDFNDEVGFQLEANYSVNNNSSINFNGSISSRHDEYRFEPFSLMVLKENKTSLAIPTLNPQYSPYWEIYLDYEYYLSLTDYIKIAADRRSEIFYDPINLINPIQPQRSTTFVLFLQYLINDSFNINASNESQWLFKFPYPNSYYTNFFSFQVSYLRQYIFGIRIENTTSIYEPNGKKEWILAETSYKLNMSNLITISFGDERGGQICSNGICRQVLPFSGLRISIISNFN